MFNIGEFARHGRVSVRMLRHYDAIGLLPPAHVDPATGYRSYAAGQLTRLNRIVALKELGFSLEQVRFMVDAALPLDELRGMLRLRRAELESQIQTDVARLARVEARLQLIEREGAMVTDEVVVRRIPAVRVAELTAIARAFEPEAIKPVITPLYAQLRALLERAGLQPSGPAIASYEDVADGDGVIVHACFPVAFEHGGESGLSIVELPEIEQAATIVHRGSMDGVLASVQALARWSEASGLRSSGYNRELYISCGPEETMVTELQLPLVVT